MQTGYFILLLIGFAWLALWSVQPKPSSKRGWWPFDMRADLDSTAETASAEAIPGRRRGAAAQPADPVANPVADAAPGQAAWRQRRALPGNRRPVR